MTELPKIISVDDHVVEPAPLVAQVRLPARIREQGPRIERARWGDFSLDGGGVLQPGDDRRRDPGAITGSTRTASSMCTSGTSRFRWTPHRRATSAGSTGRRCSLGAITYDEMRPGCYDPAGAGRGSCASPASTVHWPSRPSRASAGRPSWRARTSSSELECVRAYNDWMVEESCRGLRRCADCLCRMPMWDVELAVAEVNRNATRVVRGRLLQRDSATPRSPEHPHRILGSALRPSARRRGRRCACTSDRRRKCQPPHPDHAPVDRHHAVVQQLHGLAGRLPVLRVCSSGFPT